MDSDRRPLDSEPTDLPTEPQPLPNFAPVRQLCTIEDWFLFMRIDPLMSRWKRFRTKMICINRAGALV